MFSKFLFFLSSRLSILRVSSEVCFLLGLGQKMMPGSVVGCAENIVNTMVFVWFHFFTYSVNWMISNRLLDVFLAAFWVPWAHFFWFLRVWGVGRKIDDFRGIPWRSPGWENRVRWWLKDGRWAHYPLASIAGDYRIQDTTYRIQAYKDVDARMQDWRIRRM